MAAHCAVRPEPAGRCGCAGGEFQRSRTQSSARALSFACAFPRPSGDQRRLPVDHESTDFAQRILSPPTAPAPARELRSRGPRKQTAAPTLAALPPPAPQQTPPSAPADQRVRQSRRRLPRLRRLRHRLRQPLHQFPLSRQIHRLPFDQRRAIPALTSGSAALGAWCLWGEAKRVQTMHGRPCAVSCDDHWRTQQRCSGRRNIPDRGTLYRLRVGPFADRAAAIAACASALRAQGGDRPVADPERGRGGAILNGSPFV